MSRRCCCPTGPVVGGEGRRSIYSSAVEDIVDSGSGVPGLDPVLVRAASELNSGAIHLLRSLAAVDRQSGLTRARLSALSVLVFAGPRPLGDLASADGGAGPTRTRSVNGRIAQGL